MAPTEPTCKNTSAFKLHACDGRFKAVEATGVGET